VGSTKPGARIGMEVWRKGGSRDMAVVVGELPEDRVASRLPTRARQAEQQANRLGLVVNDLSPEQRRDMKLNGAGVIIEDVRQTVRADVRPGDVIMAVTTRGQTTELKSADQFNKLLSQIDRNATMTLHVRRGESNLFVPIRGETPPRG
jgi:serine protease Do